MGALDKIPEFSLMNREIRRACLLTHPDKFSGVDTTDEQKEKRSEGFKAANNARTSAGNFFHQEIKVAFGRGEMGKSTIRG